MYIEMIERFRGQPCAVNDRREAGNDVERISQAILRFRNVAFRRFGPTPRLQATQE